jgi:hypothetical protein
MCHDWNVSHVFPTITRDLATNVLVVPGPLFVKDSSSLKFHYDRVYTTQLAKVKAIDSMEGGSAAYRSGLSVAHTTKTNTVPAAHLAFAAPSADQPTPPPLPPPTDTAAMQRIIQQQQQEQQTVDTAQKLRATCQLRIPKKCKNCGSRIGKIFDHPSGKSAKPCLYEPNRFKDNAEGLLNIGD